MGTDGFELIESAFRVSAQFFNRFSVAFRVLPLYFRQRDALEPRFFFQQVQGVASFHASDLSRIATENGTS